LGNIREVFTVT